MDDPGNTHDPVTEPIGLSTPIPIRAYVQWGCAALVLVVIVGVAVQAAGVADPAPPAPTPEMIAEMRMVDGFEADGDCRAIGGHLYAVSADLGAPGTEHNAHAATLVRYAEDAMRRAGCEIATKDIVLENGPLAGSSRSAAH